MIRWVENRQCRRHSCSAGSEFRAEGENGLPIEERSELRHEGKPETPRTRIGSWLRNEIGLGRERGKPQKIMECERTRWTTGTNGDEAPWNMLCHTSWNAFKSSKCPSMTLSRTCIVSFHRKGRDNYGVNAYNFNTIYDASGIVKTVVFILVA